MLLYACCWYACVLSNNKMQQRCIARFGSCLAHLHLPKEPLMRSACPL